MNILILGSGGREAAICKNIFNANLFCYSNVTNPQIFKKCKHYFLFSTFSVEECVKLCRSHYINYVIIGSEKYLDTDIVSELEKNDIFCLAPNQELAKIETSKIFARTCLDNCSLGLFNPDFIVVTKQTNFMQIMAFLQKHNNNVVIKPDKPCSGKGVKVFGDHLFTKIDIIEYINELLANDKHLLVEEKIIGKEFSLHTITDGKTHKHLQAVQDFKRLLNGNKGPNTGSMGCITDKNGLVFLRENVGVSSARKVNELVLNYLNSLSKGIYKGILYGSFIIDENLSLKVIEFNARLGDPEAIPLVQNIDFSRLCENVENKTLCNLDFPIHKSSITSYIVPKKYPNATHESFYFSLEQLDEKEKSHIVFANVDNHNGCKSRTLAVYFEGTDLKKITENLYHLQDKIMKSNPGIFHCRNDFLECYFNYDDDQYKISGVDVEEGNKVVNQIKETVKSTYNESVLNEIGGFGGCFDTKQMLKHFENPILVSSIDGVGTKSIFSIKHLGIKKGLFNLGQDIVNHCVNDVLVQGAIPLYFLDYIATSKLKADNVVEFIKGVSVACKNANCVLIGGETAEMPNVYKQNCYDFVGCMTGVVDKNELITGQNIELGDIILGIPSSGPHTNGYSLIRKIVEENPDKFSKELLEECCAPHRCYLNEIMLLKKNNIEINGLCHITGGGYDDNFKRILHNGLKVEWNNFVFSSLFQKIENVGKIKNMKDIFNCGYGMLVVVNKKYNSIICDLIPEINYIGRII